MTDEEREATYERVHRALDDMHERREEYERYAAERRQRELNEPPATTPAADPIHPTRRPRQRPEGRDWAAEEVWIRGIIASVIEATIIPGVGKAIAAFAELMGKEAGADERALKAELRQEIAALRVEFEKAITGARREDMERVLGCINSMEQTAAMLSEKADALMELPSERRRRLRH